MVVVMDPPWCEECSLWVENTTLGVVERSLRVTKRLVVVGLPCCPQDCPGGWTGVACCDYSLKNLFIHRER